MRDFLRFISIFFLFFSSKSFSQNVREPAAAVLFVPNEGQWNAPFLYKGLSTGADVYLEKTGITYVTGSPQNNELIHDYKEGRSEEKPILRFHAYNMKWIGGNPNANVVPQKKQNFYHNYFLGNNPSHWKGNVPVYGNITYQNIYPGIDFYYYSENNHPKYDLIVSPNTDVNIVKLKYEGTDGLFLEKGNLIIKTSVGNVTEMKPYAYQYINGEKKEVKCDYVLSDNTIGFAFPKGYEKTQQLIIDPQLVFASLTGSTADNWGFTATYDKQGNLYAGGIVSGTGYPLSTGAFQATYGGGNGNAELGYTCDISISKFNAQGTALLYSTYIGGASNEMPHSLVVDKNNNLVIAGKTASSNFPITATAFDTSFNGGYFDIYIAKLNATGTALMGSTYIGGSNSDGVNGSANYSATSLINLKHNYGDDSRSEIIVDTFGNIYLAGNTQSPNFPVTANALKSALTGTQDGVFLKFNPTLTTMIYGTYIGGSSVDAAYNVALDTSQTKVYIAGGTMSSDFHPSSLSGAYQITNNGNVEGYIMRFQNGGSYNLLRSTYVGTSAYDQIYGLQIDLENSVYVMGQTLGNFPVSTGVYSNPGSRQFIMKIDSALTTRIYSTVYGSGNIATVNISPVAFLVDTCQNVYISGWGGLPIAAGVTNGTTNGLPVTANAQQSTTDGSDFYFIVFSKNAINLLYASFFGSPGKAEHVDGGTSRFDPNGVVYQSMCASCGSGSAFPATPGAWATVKGSSNCNLGAVKIAFNLGSVNAVAGASPNAALCVPFNVQFSNTSTNSVSWEWDFGDGGTSTAQNPSHQYTQPGIFTVRLIANNPNGCKTKDTTYLTITALNDTINANFAVTILDSCETRKVQLTNTSTGLNGGPITGATFVWDYGDGFTFTGPNPPIHNYAASGVFNVKLKMTFPNACNSPDSVVKTVNFSALYVDAKPIAPQNTCIGSDVGFPLSGVNATTHSWTFGDGQTSNLPNPSHTYADTGTYTVRYIAGNPNTCNKFDTVITTVRVNPKPKAQFTYSPLVSEPNTPFNFINQSVGANSYLWDFSDGTTSAEVNPAHTFRKTRTYNVCLTATNSYGCIDKTCKEVQATINPVVGVPSGFSPNKDGNNDVLYVRGYGIETLTFKIFNRWGELVFETHDQDKGWDGTYKGVPQEMETYGYYLSAQFIDGTSTVKKGNITLLR